MSRGQDTRGWVALIAAIVAEVVGTMSLRGAIDDPMWFPLTVLAYLVAFTLLGLALRTGMPIGVAYSVWGACGVALTALLGAVLFDEYLTRLSILGIGLIVVGVVLIESGSSSAREPVEGTS